MSLLPSLPVLGYQPQSESAVDMVNVNKMLEETILRAMDDHAKSGLCDPRWLALARTGMEHSFMDWNRSIFKPKRVSLPEDPSPEQT